MDGSHMDDRAPLVAGIELGGTKCICILARGPDAIEDRVQLPTTRPEETLAGIEAVLDRWSGFVGLGIASFGPVSIDRHAADYGHITSTPKPGWANQNVAERLRRHAGVPTGFHTDVVGAALAEARWGAAKGLADIAYVTVGTGIGVGLIAAGRPVDGLTHSEFGHIRPVRLPGDDWVGNCPYHGGCVEGLAAGPAIQARTGIPGPDLPADHPAWDQVAHALGQLLHTLVLTGVPRRIVMGGGVMVGTDHLFPKVRAAMSRSLAGYVALPRWRIPRPMSCRGAWGQCRAAGRDRAGRAGDRRATGAVVYGRVNAVDGFLCTRKDKDRILTGPLWGRRVQLLVNPWRFTISGHNICW